MTNTGHGMEGEDAGQRHCHRHLPRVRAKFMHHEVDGDKRPAPVVYAFGKGTAAPSPSRRIGTNVENPRSSCSVSTVIN